MKSLLIIDDEPLIIKYLGKLLSKNYHTFSFNNAEEAIEHLKHNNDIDFIISDYMMNNSNGIDVLEYIINKNYFINYKKQFIFMTAFNENEIFHKLNNTGCRIINKSELTVSKIEEFLSG